MKAANVEESTAENSPQQAYDQTNNLLVLIFSSDLLTIRETLTHAPMFMISLRVE